MADVDLMSPKTGRHLDDHGNVHNVIDPGTGAKTTITSDHRAIHKKEGYSISGIFAAVANGATVNYAFKTPTVASGKIIHLKTRDFYAAGNNVRTDLYEGPTDDPINGTNLSAINHFRETTPETTLMQAVKVAMDITLTGAKTIETLLFGNNSAPRSMDLEYDLDPDTWYIRTFTNGTGATADISFYEFWYEENAVQVGD